MTPLLTKGKPPRLYQNYQWPFPDQQRRLQPQPLRRSISRVMPHLGDNQAIHQQTTAPWPRIGRLWSVAKRFPAHSCFETAAICAPATRRPNVARYSSHLIHPIWACVDMCRQKSARRQGPRGACACPETLSSPDEAQLHSIPVFGFTAVRRDDGVGILARPTNF